MSSYNVCQDDDISIIQNDDEIFDVASATPNITFNLSARRQNIPPPSNGITSMSALKDAYEELKRKYNELNTRYQDLLKKTDDRSFKQVKSLPSDTPDEMKRRNEVDTLHKAVSKLKKELAAEKTKNQKLRSQIQSSVESPPNPSLTSKEIGSMDSLDKLMENIQFLEQIVEIHQMEVRKVRLHRNPSDMVASLSTSSHPRKQLEHNELDVFKPHYSYSAEPSAEIAQDEEEDNDPSWQDFKRDPFQTHNPQKVIDLHQKPKTVDTFSDLNEKTLPYVSVTHSPQNSSVAEAAYNLPFKKLLKRPEEENIICPYCSKSFHCMVKFHEHIAKCSSHGEPIESHRKCPVCEKNFQHVSQKDFEVHVNMHFEQNDGFEN